MKAAATPSAARLGAIGVLLALHLLSPPGARAQQIVQYNPNLHYTPGQAAIAQAYYQNLFQFTPPATGTGSGVMTPGLNTYSSFQNGSDYFGGGISRTLGGCLFGVCLEHTYGISDNLYFNGTGPLNYQASIPFTVTADVPNTVTQGQSITLDASIAWSGTPTVTATQAMTLSTQNVIWADFPGDGMDDLVAGFNQGPTTLQIYGEFPVVPLLPSVPYDVTVDVNGYQDLSNYGTYGYMQLGSTGTLTTDPSGTTITAQGADYIGLANQGTYQDAWYTGVDNVSLASSILMGIPTIPTEAIGGALRLLSLAGFELNTDYNIDIVRIDHVVVELENAPTVTVPSVMPGLHPSLTLDGTLDYRALFVSEYFYAPDFTLDFAGPFFDDQELFSLPLGSLIGLGQTQSGFFDQHAHFNLAVSDITVEPRPLEIVQGPLLNLADAGYHLPQTTQLGGATVSPPGAGAGSITELPQGEFTPLPCGTGSQLPDCAPVPEPASLVLLGSGLAAAAAARHARRRRA